MEEIIDIREKNIVEKQLSLINQINREYETLISFHERHPLSWDDSTANNLFHSVSEIYELRKRLIDLNYVIKGNNIIDYKEILKKAIDYNLSIGKYISFNILMGKNEIN